MNMHEAIKIMRKTPEFEEKAPGCSDTILDKARRIREECLALIRAGILNLDELAEKLKVTRYTVRSYLVELCEKGFIDYTTKGGAKIIAVNV